MQDDTDDEPIIPSHPGDDAGEEPDVLGIFRAVFVGASIVLMLVALIYIIGKRM